MIYLEMFTTSMIDDVLAFQLSLLFQFKGFIILWFLISDSGYITNSI